MTQGGRSTYGVCQFALSWQIRTGVADVVCLDDLAVVMAGWYDDDEPGSPWSVGLYVDDHADPTIELSHVPRRWSMKVQSYLTVTATEPVDAPGPVACGIPGLDRPGTEVVSDTLLVDDGPLRFEFHGRCGFATDFDYAR